MVEGEGEGGHEGREEEGGGNPHEGISARHGRLDMENQTPSSKSRNAETSEPMTLRPRGSEPSEPLVSTSESRIVERGGGQQRQQQEEEEEEEEEEEHRGVDETAVDGSDGRRVEVVEDKSWP